MKVEGSKEFDAPAQLVWDVLNDPEKMAKLLPGVESFEIQDALRNAGSKAIVTDSHNPPERVWRMLTDPDETASLVEVSE